MVTIMYFKQYTEKKEKGLAEVIKIGGGHAFALRRFDPDDGLELKSELIAVDVEEVKRRKAELLQEATDLETLIADIGALK